MITGVVQSEESVLVLGGEQQKAAHYHCNCGHFTTDYEALKQYMFQHAFNGDRNSYCTTYE